MTRILLLGGTVEATRLARMIAAADLDAVFSYAGRTRAPAVQPLPTRIGGFGGVDGLAAYLRAERITHVVDATHPFAAGMSRNAVEAAARAGVALAALERNAWRPQPGDRWTEAADIAEAVAALPRAPSRVFLAIGRQTIDAFAARPEHFYLLRFVDPPDVVPLPHHAAIQARGPFALRAELDLLRAHRIERIVAKNAGGEATRAKLDAARELSIPVIMIARPQAPARLAFERPEAVMDWLAHAAVRGV